MIERHYFAGDTQLRARGRFMRYAASASAALGLSEGLTVVVDGRKSGILLPGDSIELDEPADRWELFPVAPGAVGEVEIGQGIVRSSRVLGAVECVSGELRKVREGRSYFNLEQRTPGGGAFAVFGIIADGRDVAVTALQFNAGSTMNVRAWQAQGVPDVYTSLVPMYPRVLGGATSSVAKFLVADSTVGGAADPAFGSTTLSSWMQFGMTRLNANEVRSLLVRDAPMVIPSGWGLYIVGQTAANMMTAEAEVLEL